MLIPRQTHMTLSVTTTTLAFFGGALVFLLFKGEPPTSRFDTVLFYAAIGGLVALPYFVFWHWIGIACSQCGKHAFPQGTNFSLYVCRGCGALSARDSGKPATVPRPPSPSASAAPASASSASFGPWVVLAVAVGFFGVAVFLGISATRLLTSGVTAHARVVDVRTHYDRHADPKHRTTYTATIEYRAGNRLFAIERSCSKPCFRQGQTLKVRYLPSDPGSAEVDSLMELAGTPLLAGWLGIVFTVFAIVWMVVERKRKAAAAARLPQVRG